MVKCPFCQSAACRRSRRKGLEDLAYSLIGKKPWRCAKCEQRFRAHSVPMQNWKYAHCAICGNLELKRISPEHVRGFRGAIGRILGLSALRCEPCRHKFFSVRPLKEQIATEESDGERRVA